MPDIHIKPSDIKPSDPREISDAVRRRNVHVCPSTATSTWARHIDADRFAVKATAAQWPLRSWRSGLNESAFAAAGPTGPCGGRFAQHCVPLSTVRAGGAHVKCHQSIRSPISAASRRSSELGYFVVYIVGLPTSAPLRSFPLPQSIRALSGSAIFSDIE